MKKYFSLSVLLLLFLLSFGCSSLPVFQEVEPYKILKEESTRKDYYDVVVYVNEPQNNKQIYQCLEEIIPLMEKKYTPLKGLYITFTDTDPDHALYNIGQIKYDSSTKQIVSDTIKDQKLSKLPDKQDFALVKYVINDYVIVKRNNGDKREVSALITEALKNQKSTMTVEQFNELAVKVLNWKKN